MSREHWEQKQYHMTVVVEGATQMRIYRIDTVCITYVHHVSYESAPSKAGRERMKRGHCGAAREE